MYCQHCGDCCLRMSPISNPHSCPHLVIDGKYHFCGIYKDRPEECKNHTFHAKFCPIGISILKFDNPTDIQVWLEIGYQKKKNKRIRKYLISFIFSYRKIYIFLSLLVSPIGDNMYHDTELCKSIWNRIISPKLNTNLSGKTEKSENIERIENIDEFSGSIEDIKTRILDIVKDRGKIFQSELIIILGISKSYVSIIVSQLSKEKKITKIKKGKFVILRLFEEKDKNKGEINL